MGKKVFISGCYDILHGGHIQFFKEARALGDHLTVSFASDKVLWEHKKRRTSIPQDHKLALMTALDIVDEVVIGDCDELGLDFKEHFLKIKPDVLAVTEDDQYADAKKALCAQVGAEYMVLPKTPPQFTPVSTSSIVRNIRTPAYAPLRVDFGGGWLDVPRHSRDGAFIVNCAISPLVSLGHWDYEQKSGLGGSGAWALLNGNDGIKSELDLGVGWQDPAIIRETGLCVWRSGEKPVLHFKRNGDFLRGHMALHYTDIPHDTPSNADNERDYDMIEEAGNLAKDGVFNRDLAKLGEAVQVSYAMQRKEGMPELPEAEGCIGRKYSGGGWGGYALYLFETSTDRDTFVASATNNRPIEPYITIR
ncbi:MAG: adenylyltransferase/cytidyltransferase family protein [Coraliomargarita sp.]|nr:adenylyltransferase/cytidyltransferase family protein [Coraliomargarita sp.]